MPFKKNQRFEIQGENNFVVRMKWHFKVSSEKHWRFDCHQIHPDAMSHSNCFHLKNLRLKTFLSTFNLTICPALNLNNVFHFPNLSYYNSQIVYDLVWEKLKNCTQCSIWIGWYGGDNSSNRSRRHFYFWITNFNKSVECKQLKQQMELNCQLLKFQFKKYFFFCSNSILTLARERDEKKPTPNNFDVLDEQLAHHSFKCLISYSIRVLAPVIQEKTVGGIEKSIEILEHTNCAHNSHWQGRLLRFFQLMLLNWLSGWYCEQSSLWFVYLNLSTLLSPFVRNFIKKKFLSFFFYSLNFWCVYGFFFSSWNLYHKLSTNRWISRCQCFGD